MTKSFNPTSRFQAELPVSILGLPDALVIGEPISVRSSVEYRNADGTLLSGIWEASEGVSRWEFTDHGEVIHVLDGRMTVRQDEGDEVTLGPGDAAIFPIGWTGTWEIHERIRKLFVIFSA